MIGDAVPPTFVELKPRRPLPGVVEVLLRSGRVRVSVAIESTALRRLVDALEEDVAC